MWEMRDHNQGKDRECLQPRGNILDAMARFFRLSRQDQTAIQQELQFRLL